MKLIRRPRRNRISPAVRSLVRENEVRVDKLIFPVFLIDGVNKKEEIKSMPGIYRFTIDQALIEIEECYNLNLRTFILFPAVDDKLKDSTASYSYNSANFYLKAIREIKNKFPDVTVVTDVAMDPYNSDGHDGLVRDGKIINDETLVILGKMTLAQAEAGADIMGPSDMMDGRVGYLRDVLDEAGFTDVGIMAYTAKYASSFYGPFRDALDSAPKSGDKKTYQMDFANKRDAIIEAELDIFEGADYLMVKPALAYLDIIQLLKQSFDIPIVAYNVSGEYSMVKAAAEKGWLDGEKVMNEILVSIKRAGADIIITYAAKEFAKMLK
ncbi:MAG: porphobilinogen synthase [Spirochaetia bacterium]|nr:porphobilinogen synthase [Spirochaetia bacterium]